VYNAQYINRLASGASCRHVNDHESTPVIGSQTMKGNQFK